MITLSLLQKCKVGLEFKTYQWISNFFKKELRSWQSFITTVKTWTDWKIRINCCPRMEGWMVHIESWDPSEPELRKENCYGNQSWSGKTWIVVDKLLEAQWGQLWELKTPGGPSYIGAPQYCEIYLQKLDQVFVVSIWEQFPPASSRGSEKGTTLNTPGHSVLLNKAWSQEKVVNQSITGWGIIGA